MFTSRNLWSETVCPYSQTCVLPRCIFKHPSGKLSSAENAAATQASLDNSLEQDTPRKRQKLDEGDEERPSTSLTPETKAPSRSTAQAIPTKKSYAATRSVSPPPLKRAVQVKASPAQNGAPKPVPKAPTKTSLKAPVPLKEEGLNPRVLSTPAPTSHNMRYRLVKALHDQLARLNSELEKDALDQEERLVLSKQAVISRALDIEEEAAASPSIYSNLVKNKILVYKRMNVKTWMDERTKEVDIAKAKEAPKLAAKHKEPIKDIDTGLPLSQELVVIKRLQSHISTLGHAGYITKPPSEEDIIAANKGTEAARGWEVCDRCRTRFQVFPERRESDGALASGGACTYHSGKPYFPPRGPNDPSSAKRDKRYRCCNESVGDSSGCTRSENHVFKITEPKRLAAILPFECTPSSDSMDTDEKRPVCVDGEMGYTTYGLELIRLTATQWPEGTALFDVLVKPIGLILDLNSRYSGVWPQDFANALPYSLTPPPKGTPPPPPLPPPSGPPPVSTLRKVDSPAIARQLLFEHLTPETPLIGHGLENDVNAMRVIHPLILDTALLFPHRAGLPFRNGLKTLMSSLLGREIQVHGGAAETTAEGGTEGEAAKGGHDSKEDANAAGDLVRYAIKEEWSRMRRDGFVLDAESKIQAPPGKAIVNSDLPWGEGMILVGETVGRGTDVVVGGSGKKRGRDEVEN